MRTEPRISVRAAHLAETVAGTQDKNHLHNIANGRNWRTLAAVFEVKKEIRFT
jgi:hypothetical protein